MVFSNAELRVLSGRRGSCHNDRRARRRMWLLIGWEARLLRTCGPSGRKSATQLFAPYSPTEPRTLPLNFSGRARLLRATLPQRGAYRSPLGAPGPPIRSEDLERKEGDCDWDPGSGCPEPRVAALGLPAAHLPFLSGLGFFPRA